MLSTVVKVSSRYHQSSCGPCLLCGKHVARYDHLPALQQYIQQHMHSSSSSESGHGCICRNHRQEVQRHLGNPHNIPSWVKKKRYRWRGNTLRHGMRLPKMHSERIIILLPTCSLQSAFSDLLNTTQQVRLCVTHSQCLYRQINAHSSCAAGCGAMPKYRQGCYTRHSPDGITVSTYLNDYSELG